MVPVGRAPKTAKIIEFPKPVEDRSAIVDEYGLLEAWHKDGGYKRSRREALAKTIRGWYDSAPADQSFQVHGERYQIDVSARGRQRLVDKARTFTLLKKKRFIELCSFTIKALSDVVTGTELDNYLSEGLTGSRDLEVVSIEKQEAA